MSATDAVAASLYADEHPKHFRKASGVEGRAWAILEVLLRPHLNKGRSVSDSVRRVLATPAGVEALKAFLASSEPVPEMLTQRKGAVVPKKPTTAAEEVEELAKARRLADPLGPSLVQAKVEIWKERPDLVKRARSEAPAEVVKKGKPETLAKCIDRGIQFKVGHLQLEAPFFKMPEHEVRIAIRKTVIGQELMRLHRSPEGKLPVTEALAKIAKSSGSPERAEALKMLKVWANV